MNEKTMTEDHHYQQMIEEESICLQENLVYERPETLTDAAFHYCPGCGHGVAHRIIAEAIAELGIQEDVIGVAPVGCSVLAYNYFNIDMQEAAHGRASAVATNKKSAAG